MDCQNPALPANVNGAGKLTPKSCPTRAGRPRPARGGAVRYKQDETVAQAPPRYLGLGVYSDGIAVLTAKTAAGAVLELARDAR